MGSFAMTMTETEINQAHREKMAKIKAVKDRLYASKTKEKGLLMVHTVRRGLFFSG
jgi:cob(I)alamin adenosyltransferase